jgi:hypothetical protein
MVDQLLIALAATTLINFALILHLWVSARRVPDSAAPRPHLSFNALEHTKEMLLIDIHRREQLLDIRLQRLERAARVR